MSQRTVLLKPSIFLHKVFLRFYLSHSEFQNKLFENASGSTAKGIQRKTLEKLEISFPSDFKQQEDIAEILKEIEC